jgi:hypothetical protein
MSVGFAASVYGFARFTHVGRRSTHVGRRSTHVGRRELLRVAAHHGGDLGRNLDQLSLRDLLGALALLADAQLQLIRSSAVVARAGQHLPSQEQQRRVVIERSAGFGPDFGHRGAEGREHAR